MTFDRNTWIEQENELFRRGKRVETDGKAKVITQQKLEEENEGF